MQCKRHMQEEEGDRDRRISPRKRRRVRYIVDDDDDDEEEESDEDEEESDEDEEQPGPSTQNTHNQKTNEKGLLTVECGDKTGILDVERLERGEACILCEGRWCIPSAFESLAGKGSFRNWKRSILFENKQLQFWFEQGALKTKGFTRKRTASAKQKKILSSDYASESSSEVTEIESPPDTEEGKDEEWLLDSEETIIEIGKEEKEGGGVETDSPVTCDEKERSIEAGEMEDEATPVVPESGAKMIISTPEKSALQTNLKVVVRRLPEFPIAKKYQSTNREEFTQSNEMEEEEEGGMEINTKTGATQTPSSPAATSQEIKCEAESFDSTCSHTMLLVAVTDVGFDGDMKEMGVATSSQEAAALQEMEPETWDPETTQASNTSRSTAHAACDLDLMDLDQLRREKIKMQIKVLRLQEKYYARKMKEQNKRKGLI